MLPGMSVDVARALHTEGSSARNRLGFVVFPWPGLNQAPGQTIWPRSGALRRPVGAYTQQIDRCGLDSELNLK